MNEFTHEMFGTLRTVEVDGEVQFAAADVAKALGHSQAKDMLRSLDDDEKGRHRMPTPGGHQELTLISESGLYKATLLRQTGRMTSPETKASVRQFQRWVTHEVLPTIRQTGQYNLAEDDAPAWARDLMYKVDALSTLAKAHNEVQETSKGYSLAETARRMGVPPHRFNAILRDLGIVGPSPMNTPTRFGREMGYVERRGNTAAVPESGYEGLRQAVTSHLASLY